MYTPLNIKTNYSLLKSMIRIEELISFAKKNNLTTLTISDDNMYGAMEFYKECLKNNIKPIIGLEIRLANNTFILYAKDYSGYKNLIKLETIKSESKLNINELKKYNESLICIVPYESLNLYQELVLIYKDIYKSYKNDLEKKELEYSIYMDEILCIEEKDNQYLKYLYAIKDKTTVDKIDRKFNNHIKRIIEDNSILTNSCNLIIPFDKNLLPKYECPNNIDSYTYLKELCKEGLIRLFGSSVRKIYLERLKYELEIIHKMGFDDYFLIVYDYVKFAKEANILVAPGRGSAAGSLVSYLLNITTIDPIKYNLLFERFLNPERISMPDIDMDFDSERREEVIRYCIYKYGSKKVAPIITFSTLKTKQVIKDVAKVSNIDDKTIDVLCNMLDRNLNLLDNYNINPKIKKHLDINNDLKQVYNVSIKLENLKRQTSIHAAGVVMSNQDLTETIPLSYHENMYITGYSMEYLEELGLLKMDFLGISFLTLISDVIKDINEKNNNHLTFDSIPLDDNKVYDIFKTANTIGIFQFESEGMINFLRKLKPDKFDDIVAAIALFRPGPMGNIDTYIKRKEKKEQIKYIVKELEPILKDTYGIIIYQEQIMQIASSLASFTMAEADMLRKAMSKKKEDVLLKAKESFISGCVKNNIEEIKAKEIYELILKFASYGFNKSHSVAYSIVAYKMAYLKLYYPEIFLKNLLTRFINSSLKTKDYIYECKKNNVTILKPDINKSTSTYELTDKNLRYPLSNIKNIGAIVVNEILLERNKGLFKDIFDFIKRLYGKTVNRKVLEALILAGTFDEMSYNRKTLLNNLDVIINYSELGDILSNDENLKPILNIEEEYSLTELLQIEYDVFGFYLTNHPITKYKDSIYNLDNIDSYFDKVITLNLYVDRIKEVTTKKNEKMYFISGCEETNTIDVVLFPKVIKEIPKEKEIYSFKGNIEKRFDKYQMIVSEYKKLN